MRPVESTVSVADSSLLGNEIPVSVDRCDQNWYVPSPPATYSTEASCVAEPSRSRICVRSPSASTSAWALELAEILSAWFQVVSSSRQIHIPELSGITAHQWPSACHSFDCGLSP